MKKVKSGIYGLNPLLHGGLNEYSSTLVIGPPGAGKTTFAIQFIRRGLEEGKPGIFVSLDENKEQIIREAIEMGWREINDYLNEKSLVFIDASGKKFSEFVKTELAGFVKDWTGSGTRVAIDPLTPVLWSIRDRYEQREILAFLFKQTRMVGTMLCTLEEYGQAGRLSNEETAVPTYLADAVIYLNYRREGGSVVRNLEIIKCRSSRHSEFSHPYKIMRGLGIVIDATEGAKETKKLTEKTKKELQRLAFKLPTPIRRRIDEIDTYISDKDLGGLTPAQIISYIVDDYGETE